MDDYEEGTWDPKLRTSGASTGEQIGSGHYVKIGSKVMLTTHFENKNASNLQSNNYIQVTNLPFTPNGATCISTSPFSYRVSWTSGKIPVFKTQGSGALQGFESGSGATWQYWSSNDFRNSQIYLHFNITYFTH